VGSFPCRNDQQSTYSTSETTNRGTPGAEMPLGTKSPATDASGRRLRGDLRQGAGGKSRIRHPGPLAGGFSAE